MIKKFTEREILLNAFNFQYAGIVNIHITRNKYKYVVACSGFNLETQIYFFNKEKKFRKSFYTLGEAIQCFNYLVEQICCTMDWFKPDFFESFEFYKNIQDVYK